MRVTSRKAWSAAATLLLAGGGARVASGQDAAAAGSAGAGAAASAVTLPGSGVSLELTPAIEGPWHLTLRNEGEVPVRLLADARLLWLEVVDAPTPPDPKAKKPPKPRGYTRGKLPICRAPAELRPEGEIAQRVLLLRPGEGYEEDIDPMLLCGAGKTMAALRPGALVYPHYGYAPPTGKPKKGALPPPPYVVDSLHEPRDLVPARSIEGDGGVYFSDYVPPAPAPAPSLPMASSAAPVASGPPGMVMPAASATAPVAMPSGSASPGMEHPDMAPPGTAPPPPLVDARGPRLAVRSTALADASSATEVTVTVTLSNEGQRSALMHFRNDDVGFTVTTPTGRVIRCARGGGPRGAVRDFFETLSPGHRRSLTLRLYELCPVDTFQRPGIYSVLADVELGEGGDTYSLPATVAQVKAERPTKLRVRTGREPYHRSPPVVLPAASAAASVAASASAPASGASAAPAAGDAP